MVSTISLPLYDIRGEVALSRTFDWVAFIPFAVAFGIINLMIPLPALPGDRQASRVADQPLGWHLKGTGRHLHF